MELAIVDEVEESEEQNANSSKNTNENSKLNGSEQSNENSSKNTSEENNLSNNSSLIVNKKIGTTSDGVNGLNINNSNNNSNNDNDDLELGPAPSPSYMKSIMGEDVKELIDKRGNNNGSEFLKKYKGEKRYFSRNYFDRSKKM